MVRHARARRNKSGVPQVGLLHGALNNPVPPMYRCLRAELQMRHGGTDATWWNRVQFCQNSNVLLIIKQENDDCGPTEEAEVMYRLGQTFRKTKNSLWNLTSCTLTWESLRWIKLGCS